MVNDGSRFIVFNCSNPTYLNITKKFISIKNTELNQNQDGTESQVNGKKIFCDLPTNMWKEVEKYPRLVTYNPVKKEFGFVVEEEDLKLLLRLDLYDLTEEQVEKLKNESLITSIMKTFHHPRYFY